MQKKLLLVLKTEVLNIDSLHLGHPALHRRLLEILAGPQLANGAGLLELPLELFERALNVLSFLYWYDNHALNHLLFLCSFFLRMQR